MTLADMEWGLLKTEVPRLAEAALPFAEAASFLRQVPGRTEVAWCDPDAKTAFARSPGPWAEAVKLTGFEPEFGHGPLPPGFGERPWVPVKLANGPLRPLFDAMQFTPNSFNKYFGGPTPVASSLAGGLLGAGLGYGAGWAGEKLFGKDVLNPGRLRRLGALLGGGAGALPGAYLGSVGMRMNAQDGKSPWSALVKPNPVFGKESLAREMVEDLDEVMPIKIAQQVGDGGGGDYMPMIPVDSFNRVLWQDPNTPVGLRAITSGLIESASQSRDGAHMVSPFDIGRIAISMGSGLVSGMIVGRVLGALAGLTPEAQKTLKQTGMWAGALSNVIPKAFGF